jgi:hypothetical protein
VQAQVDTLVSEAQFSDTHDVVPVDAIDTVSCHPNFADAVSLHRTIEAIVRSSSTGRWEAVV